MFPIIKNHRQKAASSLPSRQVHWRMDGQGWLFWTLIILFSFCNRTSFVGASDIPNFKIQTQNCFVTISYITNSFTVFTSLVFSHLLVRTHRIQVSVFSTSYRALEKKPLDGREFQHSTWNMISLHWVPSGFHQHDILAFLIFIFHLPLRLSFLTEQTLLVHRI